MADTVQLSRGTFFSTTPIYDQGGTLVFGLARAPILSADDDVLVRVEQNSERRPDRVAQQYYQDSKLWWVIALVNGAVDPLGEFEIGRTIRIPDIKRVREITSR
jgi:Base plate wedge protein 53